MSKTGVRPLQGAREILGEHSPKKRSDYCWGKGDKDTLLRMVEKGIGWRDIAARIGRTPAACNAMYHLLITKK